MKHLINKLTFDVSCSDEQQAFVTREHFLNELYEEMISVIELCCNRASDDLRLIQLDKLEVNLKTFKNKFVDKQEYIHLFGEAFEKELKQKLPVAARKQTARQSRRNILSWFLLTGTLPWWAEGKEVDLDDWCNKIQEGAEGKSFIFWLKKNKSRPELWQRIARQLPARFKAFIIDAIPELATARTAILTSYQALAASGKLSPFAGGSVDDSVNDFVLISGERIINETKPVSEQKLFSLFLATVLSDADIQTLPDSLAREIIDRQHRVETPVEIQPDDGNNKTIPDAADKIKTAQAGIVLIAAFLKEYYQRMDLWKEGSWVSESARQKAVYLLYYLGTGRQAPFEYELSAEKIICGLPVGFPLNRNYILTESDLDEADELLRAVIRHWTVLKKTSITGLRQAFFQRSGSLSMKNGNWILEVERKTIDILLEQIPWGYATVTLPWNKYLIFTAW